MTLKQKTLINSDNDTAQSNVPDIHVWGPDVFKLIAKASSEAEGWMKSTKAMEIIGEGCIVQVTTQQTNPSDGSSSVAEALTFVPGVMIHTVYRSDGVVAHRKLISANRTEQEPGL